MFPSIKSLESFWNLRKRISTVSRGSSSSVRMVLAQSSICYQQKRWLFLKQVFWVADNKPSRDLCGQASATLHADHCWWLIPPRTLEAWVAEELSLRACTLREQYPGACAQAPHQKDAHTKRRLRPRQMDDGTHADASKAEAEPTSKLKLGNNQQAKAKIQQAKARIESRTLGMSW